MLGFAGEYTDQPGIRGPALGSKRKAEEVQDSCEEGKLLGNFTFDKVGPCGDHEVGHPDLERCSWDIWQLCGDDPG